MGAIGLPLSPVVWPSSLPLPSPLVKLSAAAVGTILVGASRNPMSRPGPRVFPRASVDARSAEPASEGAICGRGP